MKSLCASDLLKIWEEGANLNLVQRGLLLLSACWPEKTPEDLAMLPLGKRDAKLLCLREEIFGLNLSGLTTCPHCGQYIETSFTTDEVRAISPNPEVEGAETISLSADGYEVHLRLPNSQDMYAISNTDYPISTEALIRSCVTRAAQNGIEISAEKLPESILMAVAHRMAEKDPQAYIDLELTCPECGHKWLVPFDILSFLWTEIDAWAFRTIQDVHSLALAYGWSEAEILSMSCQKRQAYLDLVGG